MCITLNIHQAVGEFMPATSVTFRRKHQQYFVGLSSLSIGAGLAYLSRRQGLTNVNSQPQKQLCEIAQA